MFPVGQRDHSHGKFFFALSDKRRVPLRVELAMQATYLVLFCVFLAIPLGSGQPLNDTQIQQAIEALQEATAKHEEAINTVWVLVCAFLVFCKY